MSLNWKGDQVKSRVLAAAAGGIDSTMAACVLHAKSNHGAGARGAGRFVSRTGHLERSTRIIQPARRRGSATVGKWGASGARYARRIEFGFQGQDAAGRSVNAPALPFLFPAARVEYPKLAGRIKAAI